VHKKISQAALRVNLEHVDDINDRPQDISLHRFRRLRPLRRRFPRPYHAPRIEYSAARALVQLLFELRVNSITTLNNL
jgi:hypothetical protein